MNFGLAAIYKKNQYSYGIHELFFNHLLINFTAIIISYFINFQMFKDLLNENKMRMLSCKEICFTQIKISSNRIKFYVGLPFFYN